MSTIQKEAVATPSASGGVSPNGPKASNGAIAIVTLIMFMAATCIAIFHRELKMDATFSLFLVAFSSALVGCLVLFHLLSSVAAFNNPTYKLGGAIAGFVFLFCMFYKTMAVPFANENDIYRLSTSVNVTRLVSIADDYDKVRSLNCPWFQKFANNKLQSDQAEFDSLSTGNFAIRSDETPTYLVPIVQTVKTTYQATSLVSPETFWNQPWAPTYTKANFDAVKRGVNVTRIFIIPRNADKKYLKDTEGLMAIQAANGVHVRVLHAIDYTGSQTDMRDFLIADDTLAGELVTNVDDGYDTIHFAVDPSDVQDYRQIWQNLYNSSTAYMKS